jgi:hypothetical protein
MAGNHETQFPTVWPVLPRGTSQNRMPTCEVIMYSTSKKRVLLATISSEAWKSYILEKTFLIGKIKQNFGLYLHFVKSAVFLTLKVVLGIVVQRHFS